MEALPGQSNVLPVTVMTAAGLPITGALTVNCYLKQTKGTHAGKWWQASDSTWSATEALAGTATVAGSHGTWEVTLATGAWENDATYWLEAYEASTPSVPISSQVFCRIAQSGDAYAVVTDADYGNEALASALTALTTSSGSGPYGITLTAKDADGYLLEGVSVYLNKAGETYKGLTDADGEYHCDADTIGTWTIRASHPIYQYAGGTLTTTGDNATMDIPMTRLTIEPAPAGQTTLAVTVLDNDLQPVADATVQIQVSAAPADSAGYSFDGDSIYLTTDANGLATHRVLAGALCRVLAGGNGWVQFTASTESTTQIASYVRTKP